MSTTRVLRLFLSCSLVSLAFSGPYSRRSNFSPKRQAGRDVVSGVGTRDENGNYTHSASPKFIAKPLPGNVYIRREVRDMKDNFPDHWNLYLLGLDSLQNTDQNDPYSYYGLAGKESYRRKSRVIILTAAN